MLILIVGGRYGSAASDETKQNASEKEDVYKRFNSITKKEYETARDRDIPIFIFVDKNVLAEHHTFKRNRENKSVNYAYVDSINIFNLLDEILAQRRNNYIKGFENFDDISGWLKDQWAGLFADFLSRTKADPAMTNLSDQVSELRQIASALKEYNEAILQKIKPDNFESIITDQQQKLKKATVQRFAKETLIEYMRSLAKERENLVSSPTKLFEIFQASKSLEEFLQKYGADQKWIDSYMANMAFVEKDYNELVVKYIIQQLPNTAEVTKE